MNERYIELIDKYFHQELSESEQQEFDDYLQNDPTFQEEIHLYKELNEAIFEVKNQEILHVIEQEHLFFEKQQVKNKWIKRAFITTGIVLFGIILWFLFNKKTEKNTPILPEKEEQMETKIKTDSIINTKIMNDSVHSEIVTEKVNPNSIKEPVVLDTIWWANDFEKELIFSEKITSAEYLFNGRKLMIYGLNKIDFEKSLIKLINNKIYFIEPIQEIAFEFELTKQAKAIHLLTKEKVHGLLTKKTDFEKNRIQVEQKMLVEKKVNTKFSIFAITLKSKEEGYQLIPEKNLLIWTKNLSEQFGQNFNIIFIPENKTYYLQQNKKYFHLFVVKKLNNLEEVTDLSLIEYLTYHSSNILIKTHQIEDDLINHDY